MLLESLVKATVELQGFRVVTVTGDARGLVAELAPDLRYAPRVASVGTGAGIGTPAGSGTFGMCRCGGSRWRCAMRRGACGVRGAMACMSRRCPGSVGHSS